MTEALGSEEVPSSLEGTGNLSFVAWERVRLDKGDGLWSEPQQCLSTDERGDPNIHRLKSRYCAGPSVPKGRQRLPKEGSVVPQTRREPAT